MRHTTPSFLAKLAFSVSESTPRREFIFSTGLKLSGLLSVVGIWSAFVREAYGRRPGGVGQSYNGVACPKDANGKEDCTVSPGCGPTGTECGNGGFTCSPTILSCKADPACCKCKGKWNGACPPGTRPGIFWVSCCLCAKHAGSKIGRVFQYQDCCGPNPVAGVPDCPAKCYKIRSVYTCGGGATIPCVSTSSKDWCTGTDIAYCTLPGQPSGSGCCQH